MSDDTTVRTVEVATTFHLAGRGTVYVVRALEPPIAVGERVLVHGSPRRVIGRESVMTNPPNPVYNGMQGLLLDEEKWPEGCPRECRSCGTTPEEEIASDDDRGWYFFGDELGGTFAICGHCYELDWDREEDEGE